MSKTRKLLVLMLLIVALLLPNMVKATETDVVTETNSEVADNETENTDSLPDTSDSTDTPDDVVDNTTNTEVDLNNISYTRNFPSNDGTIELNLTGLELSDSKEYQFALVTKGGTPETNSWNLITNYTTSTAKLVLSSGTSKIVNVLKVTDEGQIFIREKDNTEGYIVNRLNVNLTLPYLQSIMYDDINNGYNLHLAKLYGEIGNSVSWGTDNTYTQWKKIEDTTLITKFLEVKNGDRNLSQLESYLPTCPIDNYSPNKSVEYKNKNDGLYLLWVKRTGENCKEVYSCIVHDGLPDATTVEEYLGTVETTISVNSVSLPSTKTVKLGSTLTLTPTFNPSTATNKIVTWTSSDETVATVDNAGKITPKKVGSTIITVTSQDGNKKATCTVTVTAAGKNENPENTPNKSDKQNTSTSTNKDTSKDNTTSKDKLPNTGRVLLFWVIGIVAISATVAHIRYKKLYM